jgi:heme/copper-type cytochrome/quinol oxidase subunit 3
MTSRSRGGSMYKFLLDLAVFCGVILFIIATGMFLTLGFLLLFDANNSNSYNMLLKQASVVAISGFMLATSATILHTIRSNLNQGDQNGKDL